MPAGNAQAHYSNMASDPIIEQPTSQTGQNRGLDLSGARLYPGFNTRTPISPSAHYSNLSQADFLKGKSLVFLVWSEERTMQAYHMTAAVTLTPPMASGGEVEGRWKFYHAVSSIFSLTVKKLNCKR